MDLSLITTPHVPLPAADALEDAAPPDAAQIVGTMINHMETTEPNQFLPDDG